MVFEARLRSQTPMSQSELMPRRASSGQLFVGNFVETADVAAVIAAQLRQPHVGALGDEHGAGHPCRVGREFFVLVRGIAEGGHLGLATMPCRVLAACAARRRRGRRREG